MNKLTEEEFTDRMEAIQRARRIFIKSGLTKNISEAFRIYQEVFAQREREIFISDSRNMIQVIMEKYDKLPCPECGSDLMFMVLDENPEGYKIQLTCSNVNCDTVLYSEHDLKWWLENLENEYARTIVNPETRIKKRRHTGKRRGCIRRTMPSVRR